MAGKEKVLKGTITAKVRTNVATDKELRPLNNKGNWTLEYSGDLPDGVEITAVEITKASVGK